ncbi:MAG: VWA domain-containing protein [Acidobacteriia bacterium]|nr:VWA domain-containing protein [Terriglobia bacterium]
MRALRLFLAVLFLSSFVMGVFSTPAEQRPTASPQNPEMPQTKLRVDVGLVTVGVRVTDHRGREVPGLTANDFTLLDDDQPQKLAYFSNQELPISLLILLDESSSMRSGQKLDRAKEAALTLVHSSHAQTEFLFIPFNHMVYVGPGFTQDRHVMESEIMRAEASGGTSLYDALFVGLQWCTRASQPRQVMVVISDGTDEHSLHTLNQTVRSIMDSQVQVYTIGYYDAREAWALKDGRKTIWTIDRRPIDNPRLVLENIAKESGAEAFFPENDKELSRAVEKIAKDVRTQYTLAFYPPDNAQPGQYRTVKVKVDRKGLNVRARPGYTLSPQP